MKELLAGFAIEIFRPIVTLLIPGFWALTFWVVSLFLHYPATWKFASTHSQGSALVFVVASTAAGMILENVGSRLEKTFFDRSFSTGSSWYSYLALAFDPEPIGLRYIRTIVIRMKFEFAMGCAGLVAIIGVICVPVNLCWKVVAACLIVSLTGYLIYEGASSVEHLEKTRVGLRDALERSKAVTEDAKSEVRA